MRRAEGATRVRSRPVQQPHAPQEMSTCCGCLDTRAHGLVVLWRNRSFSRATPPFPSNCACSVRLLHRSRADCRRADAGSQKADLSGSRANTAAKADLSKSCASRACRAAARETAARSFADASDAVLSGARRSECVRARVQRIDRRRGQDRHRFRRPSAASARPARRRQAADVPLFAVHNTAKFVGALRRLLLGMPLERRHQIKSGH
jgi:hypothetical protein